MHTIDRIKKIAEFSNIRSYLEVGVHNGKTFNALTFPYKVAVDPKFLFDYKELATDCIKYHEVTSDEYFTAHAKGEQFDLIFIDGLHTFDQTLRDFNNALMCSHSSTIIIIDDVYPNDVFSSLRKDAAKQRKLFDPTSQDRSWHGDVFKTIFMIHDYYPGISYVTVDRGYGNPQSILFRKARRNFAPAFKNIEMIERMDYFSFMEHRDLLNLMPENAAFEVVRGFLCLDDGRG